MIYITCALYYEAKPFIDFYHLKKDTQYIHFEQFSNDHISLIITGTNPINAAIATTYLLSTNLIHPTDLFLNFGIAGAVHSNIRLGTLCLANHIIDLSSNRQFYPDILYSHSFCEVCLATSPKPILGMDQSLTHCDLVDMEASGCYQAASHFFHAHQIFVVKLVSDHLMDAMNADATMIKELLSLTQLAPLYHWLSSYHLDVNQQPLFNDDELSYITDICNQLHLSVTLKHEFRQICCFMKLSKKDVISDLQQMNDDLMANPCKTKFEGKRYFEQFKLRTI